MPIHSISDLGVDVCLGLQVGPREPISLSLNKDGGAYLVIGTDIEVLLAESHVAALSEQSTAVLADMRALDRAEQHLVHAHDLSEQARNSAEHARAQARNALAVGATIQAQEAQRAADNATDAAALVQTALQAALDAIGQAEEATEAAGQAAATAARAVATRSQLA
ncbi:hypothetical protein ALI144C_09050 [Actinosynnema sp. ALI-1.44]|uniref:hypothetical protein n=1 Tax=Actinosynnema sp. ALI-1.44 TaxID=1933779 RepID=UPI00097BF1ED|nr:hypothetical protein [Actinosynnema sp. ALI-1.44]ONI87523.1 hypothetical protein ALI144C_09050 [Actinosynnema sp. ALI-1.44]